MGMEYKNERNILSLNNWAWIGAVLVGTVAATGGSYLVTSLGISCVGTTDCARIACELLLREAIFVTILGITGITAGIIGKKKIVAAIDAKNFDAISETLLLVALIGCIGCGAGIGFLLQYIYIKQGASKSK